MEYAQMLGFFLLIALVLFANGNDIYRYFFGAKKNKKVFAQIKIIYICTRLSMKVSNTLILGIARDIVFIFLYEIPL